jgi:hypothetical protein
MPLTPSVVLHEKQNVNGVIKPLFTERSSRVPMLATDECGLETFARAVGHHPPYVASGEGPPALGLIAVVPSVCVCVCVCV